MSLMILQNLCYALFLSLKELTKMIFMGIMTKKFRQLFLLIFHSTTAIDKGLRVNALGRLDIKATQFTLFNNKPHKFQQLTKLVNYLITLQFHLSRSWLWKSFAA